MKRRSFVGYALGLPLLTSGEVLSPAAKSKRLFRAAHVTDIHVKHGEIPEQGMAKAFEKVRSLKPAADFIINTGDSIWDALEVDQPTAQAQWKLFHQIAQARNQLHMYSCIGNHDIWGWFNKREEDKLNDAYGKKWAIDELRIPARYYSIDRNGWTLIFLDSTQLNPAGGYIAYLDAEQMEWLHAILVKSKDRHVCIFSHIPILSIGAGLFFNKTQPNGDLIIQRNLMHTDFFKLRDIFATFSNIRACVSGHIHLQDDITYMGIRYLCNGAVSGNWWKGSFQGFAPAVATLDFFEDGRIENNIVPI